MLQRVPNVTKMLQYVPKMLQGFSKEFIANYCKTTCYTEKHSAVTFYCNMLQKYCGKLQMFQK